LQRFVRLQADVTANRPEHQALLKRFGLFGPPGIIVLTPDGRELHRVVGFTPPADFARQLAALPSP
jgi:thiol:disulfide interchange protein DsbD